MLFRILFFLMIAITTVNIDGLIFGDQDAVIDVAVASIGDTVEKALLMAAGLSLFLTRRKHWLNVVALGLIVGITFVCAALTDFSGFDWSRYSHSLFTLTAFLLFLTASPTDKDQSWVLKTIALTPVAAVLLGAVYEAIGLRSAFSTDTLGVFQLQGSFRSAAWLGAMAGSALFCAIRLGEADDRRFLILAFANAAILAMTAARAPVTAGTALALATLIWGFKRRPFVKLGAFAVLCSMLVPAAALFGDNLVRRYTESGLNGRNVLWASVEPAMRDYPLFGVGLGHQPLILPPEAAREAGTWALHNEFMRLTLELGTVGCWLFFILLLAMMINLAIRERIEMLGTYMVAIGCFGLYCYSDNAFSVPSIGLLLPLAVMATKRISIRANSAVGAYENFSVFARERA